MKALFLSAIQFRAVLLIQPQLLSVTLGLRALLTAWILSGATVHAQLTVDWLKTGGTSEGRDYPSQLVRSPNGQFYVCGMFGGPDSSPEAVMFKLDSAGNEISRHLWRGAYANAVAVATNGDYYLTGYVQDPDLLGVGQKYDFYLAKYAADGSLLWERTSGTLRTDGRTYQDDGQAGNAILLDAEGNVVVAGRSQGPAVYGSVSFPDTLGGPLLCKYSPEGALLWAKRAEGSRQFVFGQWFGFGEATALMLDPGGNIIIGGTMTDGSANFGGIVVTINGYFDYGPFTAKYTATGDDIWVNTLARAGTVDPQGNVYATDHHAEATMVCELYKFNPSGTTLWHRSIRGVTLDKLAVDGRGETIYAGSFSGSVQLDGYQLQNDSPELPAGLVAKADATGKFQWVVTGTCSNLSSYVKGVLRDPNGSIYACGTVSCSQWEPGTTSCDGVGLFGSLPLSIEHGGDSDLFLARITDPAPVSVALKIARGVSGLTLSWPLSASGFVLESANSLSATIWNIVPNAPVLEGGQNVVTLDIGPGSLFFRLHQP